LPIKNVLLKYWGYSSFRPLQEEIIQSVLEGKDTLALLPTGGGKSICYQVPGLLNDGICLVISPLIALMKDQVEALKRKGIKAIAIYSGMHYEQIEIAINNCLFDDIKFLYVSPERLTTELFKVNLKRMKINLIAVDEAHCISHWGYDFRPPYLKIAAIREWFPKVPVIALTATATIDVVEDIQEKLCFKKKNVFIKSFHRNNLSYVVYKEEDKLNRLLRIIEKVKGTGIVYVRNRKKTKEISDFLKKHKISSDFYHAGLENKIRENRQKAWMQGTTRIIVCTNAFGMGIDKPEVRLVVHMDLPDSIEAYFQEAGRAGRDEKKSYAVLLWENADVISLYQSYEQSYPEPEVIKTVYNALGNYLQIPVGSGKDQSYDFDIIEFSSNYSFHHIIAYNCLKFLEKEGYLSLPDKEESFSQIHIKVSKENLYRFQVEKVAYDKFIKILLRMYGGLFMDFVKISERDIAIKNNLKTEDVISSLEKLNNTGILTYLPLKTKPQIVYCTERLDKNSISITKENYHQLKERAGLRIKSVVEYINNENRCRSTYLVKYFGEKNAVRCGTCDICLSRNKTGLYELEFDEIIRQIKPKLKNSGLSLEEIISSVKNVNADKVIKAVQWLEENNKLIINRETNKYIWI